MKIINFDIIRRKIRDKKFLKISLKKSHSNGGKKEQNNI